MPATASVPAAGALPPDKAPPAPKGLSAAKPKPKPKPKPVRGGRGCVAARKAPAQAASKATARTPLRHAPASKSKPATAKKEGKGKDPAAPKKNAGAYHHFIAKKWPS